jgi:hypothetical protein
MSVPIRRCRGWLLAIAAATALGVTALAALGKLPSTVPSETRPAGQLRAASPDPTAPSTPAPAPSNQYRAGVPDLCALMDLTLVQQQGFEQRDRNPFAGPADSSCTIVMRLADAPRLSAGTVLDPSRELVAIRAEATSFQHDTRQAEWTWRTRRDSLSRIHHYDDQQVRQVVGLGAQAFATGQATLAPRGRGIWSHGLHVWHDNLYLHVKVTSIGGGRRFTHAHTQAMAVALAVDLLTALHR